MKELDSIKESYVKDMSAVKTLEDLNNLRVNYLGKNGHLTTIMKVLKDLSVEEKKAFGIAVNELKGEVTKGIEEKTEELKNAALLEELNTMPKVDLTVPSAEKKGSLHPVTIIQERLINIFRGMGFAVEDGNEVETEYNNFEAVNIPKFHHRWRFPPWYHPCGQSRRAAQAAAPPTDTS